MFIYVRIGQVHDTMLLCAGKVGTVMSVSHDGSTVWVEYGIGPVWIWNSRCLIPGVHNGRLKDPGLQVRSDRGRAVHIFTVAAGASPSLPLS